MLAGGQAKQNDVFAVGLFLVGPSPAQTVLLCQKNKEQLGSNKRLVESEPCRCMQNAVCLICQRFVFYCRLLSTSFIDRVEENATRTSNSSQTSSPV